jgi:AcrR family transcriptional regulator
VTAVIVDGNGPVAAWSTVTGGVEDEDEDGVEDEDEDEGEDIGAPIGGDVHCTYYSVQCTLSSVNAAIPERGALDRDAIVARAVAFADEHGTDALSMRKLAAELGYEVMSLYNHVANKAEVLSLMVDAVAAEIPPPDPDVDPILAVRTLAVDTRAALVRHPWAAGLWLRQLPGPARLDHMEHLLAALAATDMEPPVAHLAFHAVNNHVIGYTLQEQAMAYVVPPGGDADALARSFLEGVSADDHPHTVTHVQQHLDGDTASSFELVLDLILDGLARLR